MARKSVPITSWVFDESLALMRVIVSVNRPIPHPERGKPLFSGTATNAAPALSLVDQTVQSFWDDGIRDIGVIQGTNAMTDWSRPVQIASVQTLRRRPIPEADVIIIDECHRWFDFYGQWMSDPRWQGRPFIGLSATPWTRGLGQYFDDLIIAATTKDLVSEGYLSPFRVFAPSHPDLTGVRTVAGDYYEQDLSRVMNNAPLVADVVDTWQRRAQRPANLLFCRRSGPRKTLASEVCRGWRFNGLYRRIDAN
jgi:superfamily II DNA or RNA helicase